MIELFIGAALAAVLLLFSKRTDALAEQNLLGYALLVATWLYVVFALLWGDVSWLLIELSGVAIYSLFYVLFKKYSAYWLAAGWAAHPLWDGLLHLSGNGQALTPHGYALACLSFDLIIAGAVVIRLHHPKPFNHA